MSLKIVGWSHFDCEYPTKKLNKEELDEVIQLIKDDIVKNEYLFSGEEHQNELTGVPVFSDGTCFRASMRCWGSIMAELYVDENGDHYSYMDFYMSLGECSHLPDFELIDIEVGEVDEPSFGCTLKADRELMEEALSMGIDLMTTDKVLKKKFAQMKEEKGNL